MKIVIKGSKKGRGRGAQESHPTQDYPYPPPLHHPTRNSTGVVPRLPLIGSIISNPSPLRIVEGNPVFANNVEDVTPSISTGSPNISGPFSEHATDVDALTAQLTSQAEAPRQVALQPASHHKEVDDKFQPLRENPIVPQDEHVLEKMTTPDVPPSSQCSSPSHSLNMTEFARGLQDDSNDDRDVVESAPPGHDYVHGHKVKTETARLVGAIFEKYGDITSECNVKSQSIRSFFLERVCVVYQTLEERKLSDLTRAQINVMLDELHLFKTHKLNVGWLLQRLEQISETTSSLQEYLRLKDEAERCMESNRSIKREVERHRILIGLIRKNISTLEERMVENEAKAENCKHKAIDIKTRANSLQTQSLVHDLL